MEKERGHDDFLQSDRTSWINSKRLEMGKHGISIHLSHGIFSQKAQSEKKNKKISLIKNSVFILSESRLT
jgi:hypothetical protein